MLEVDEFLHARRLRKEIGNVMKLEYVPAAKLLERGVSKNISGATGGIFIPTITNTGEYIDQGRIRLLGNATQVDEKGIAKSMRYTQPYGVSLPPYFGKTSALESASFLNKSVSLFITEGEIKAAVVADALETIGLGAKWIVVGLRGVSMHGPDLTNTHFQGLHHSLAAYQFAEWNTAGLATGQIRRRVVVCFDWDFDPSDHVQQFNKHELKDQVLLEEQKLTAKFHVLGAEVEKVRLSKLVNSDNVNKLAVDDLLALEGYNFIKTVLYNTEKCFSDMMTASYEREPIAKAAMTTRFARYRQTQWLDMCTKRIFNNVGQLADATEQFTLTMGVPRGATMVNVTKPCFKWESVRQSNFANVAEIVLDPSQKQGVLVTNNCEYNMWRGWKRKAIEGDVSPWLDWCNFFFNKDPDFQDHFHNWVAHLIQKPHVRHLTSIIFASLDEGSGKSFTAETIAEMIGTGNDAPATIVSSGAIFEVFNTQLAGKLLAIANEPSSDNEDHAAKWKDYRTSKYLEINEKYGAKYLVANMLNFIATTNRAYVTKVSDRARREAVYKPEGLDLKQARQLIRACFNWLNNEQGYEKIFYWYLHRDIGSFNARDPAPLTKGLQDMVEDSLTGCEFEVQDFIRKIRNWMHTNNKTELLLACGHLHEVFWKFTGRQGTHYSAQQIRKALRNIEGVERLEYEMTSYNRSRSLFYYINVDKKVKQPSDKAIENRKSDSQKCLEYLMENEGE